jgi:hypothetical protein
MKRNEKKRKETRRNEKKRKETKRNELKRKKRKETKEFFKELVYYSPACVTRVVKTCLVTMI